MDGQVKKQQADNISYTYLLYIETKDCCKLNFTSLTIDGKSYTIKTNEVSTPVIIPDASDKPLVNKTSNSVLQIIIKPVNVIQSANVKHAIVIKGTVKAKPFVIKGTATRLKRMAAM